MSKTGWEGIEVLDESPMELVDDQIAIKLLKQKKGRRFYPIFCLGLLINRLGFPVGTLALVMQEKVRTV